uniref:C2H2-type domain-containing protein n=1 Tax=Anopheles coluzzii TaxID=1518534 RepID=A0A8W7PVI2_ANOCL
MDKRSKKRKSQPSSKLSTESKKLKLAEEEQTKEPAASDNVSKEAVAAVPSSVDQLHDLQADISSWLEKQEEFDQMDLEALEEASNHDDEPEDDIDLEALDVPVGVRCAKFTDTEMRKSYKYECEWGKCKFMSGTDRKYFLHVESHAELALETEAGKYTCRWDLCEYSTEDGYEFVGHVHYHAYHTKLKVHGASLHLLLKLPNCNNDSRTRNTITNRPVTFQCEWNECSDRFNKALHFFHHVKGHIDDMWPAGKWSSQKFSCKWALCTTKSKLTSRKDLMKHLVSHTTERLIACFNCGTHFRIRDKFVDHCNRQLEIAHRKYQCDQCGRYYATKPLLNNHMQYHRQAHACELCPAKFSSPGLLAAHIRIKHLNQRDFKCPQCDYASHYKKDLVAHILGHEGKLFRCEEFGCNVVYRTLLGLKKHISWHYNLPTPVYACHLCDNHLRYKSSTSLKKHFLFKHDMARPPGMSRFRFKPDTDGMYRLQSFVDEKLRKHHEEQQPLEQQQNSGEANEGTGPTGSKGKRKQQTSQAKAVQPMRDEAKPTALAEAMDAPKPKLKINSMKSIGIRKFQIELGVEAVEAESSSTNAVPAATASPSGGGAAIAKQKLGQHGTAAAEAAVRPPVGIKQEKVEESNHFGTESTKQPKDVKDFMVMKRYLKSSAKPSINA